MLGGTGREKKDGGGRSATAAFTGSGVVLGFGEQTNSPCKLPLLGAWNQTGHQEWLLPQKFVLILRGSFHESCMGR